MTDISAEQIESNDETGFSSAEYNEVAKIAELASINLLKVKANFSAGFQINEKTKLTFGRKVLSCGFDTDQSAAHVVFQYFIRGKNPGKDAFVISVDYAIIYLINGIAAPNAAKAFAHNVGGFAAYPYFRALAAHLAWAANLELPPLPTIAAQPKRPTE